MALIEPTWLSLVSATWCLRRSILENGEVDRDERGGRETREKYLARRQEYLSRGCRPIVATAAPSSHHSKKIVDNLVA